MKNKIVIFDLDGVLFDTTKCVEDFMLARYKDLNKDILRDMLSGNFHEGMAKFKTDYNVVEESPEVKAELHRKYSEDKAQCSMYEGMSELLNSLKDECLLTINTSAADATTLPLLERAGIKDLFDFVGTAEFSKSKVEKFKMIEEKFGIPKDKSIFVTDSLGDIREADMALVPTIAVTWGAHDVSYFNREPHENLKGIAHSPAELLQMITKLLD